MSHHITQMWIRFLGRHRAYLLTPTHEVTYHFAPYIMIVFILPAHLVKSNRIHHMVREKVDMKIMGQGQGTCPQDNYLVHTRKEKKKKIIFQDFSGSVTKSFTRYVYIMGILLLWRQICCQSRRCASRFQSQVNKKNKINK